MGLGGALLRELNRAEAIVRPLEHVRKRETIPEPPRGCRWMFTVPQITPLAAILIAAITAIVLVAGGFMLACGLPTCPAIGGVIKIKGC